MEKVALIMGIAASSCVILNQVAGLVNNVSGIVCNRLNYKILKEQAKAVNPSPEPEKICS